MTLNPSNLPPGVTNRMIEEQATGGEEVLEDRKHIQYVAHCPSCGTELDFAKPMRDGNVEAISASCSVCGRRWSMVFEFDSCGTFGVMSFQCDNEDRIL